MAANNNPLFIGVPNTGIGTVLTTANTAKDGTGTQVTLFTAGTNGSYVRRLLVKALGTNTASVLLVFVNNGSTNATAANNAMIRELALPATTISEIAQTGPDLEVPLNLVLAAGYTLMACIGTTVAAGWIVTAEGGNY